MEASIDSVRVAGTPDGPVAVVILTSAEREDVLPIFIGFEEATSIVRGLEAEDVGRPLTHDLLLDVMEELGGRVDRVVVCDVLDGTYIANLHVETPRGHTVVDARPSDSLALAARTNAPIEVEIAVFDDGGQSPERFEELDELAEVGIV